MLISSLRADPQFLWPNYSSGSIGNVPATMAAMFKRPYSGLPSLPASFWQPLGDDIERVVLIILDAMGQNLLEQYGSPPAFSAETAIFETMTSIFPSTTVAALSSYWTGTAPANHGLLGLKLFFPEYATAGQMLSFTPAFKRFPDALIDAGLKPEEFLQTEGVGDQFAQHGITTYALKGHHILESALSKMHGRGVQHNLGVVSFADLLVQTRTILETERGGPLFINGYWPSIDTLSHQHGWNGESVAAELRALFWQIEHELVGRLSRNARRGTVLLLSADHGQALTPKEQHIFVEDHPQLEKMLFMRPVGEPRVAYLYTRHGCQTAVIDYINQELGHAFVALSGETALEAGLLGPQPFVAEAAQRVGDVIVIAKSGYVLLNKQEKGKAEKMIGRHGSMTVEEMQVPWMAYRLG